MYCGQFHHYTGSKSYYPDKVIDVCSPLNSQVMNLEIAMDKLSSDDETAHHTRKKQRRHWPFTISNNNNNNNDNNENLQWHFHEVALHPLFPDRIGI